MGRRFRGESDQKVDGKGRVSIPAEFRKVIEAGDPSWCEGKAPEFLIVYGDEKHKSLDRKFLECYTMEAVEEVDAQIDSMPRGTIERRVLEHLFYKQSQRATVDETGRIVLPAKLRNKIDLEGTAYFVAMGDTFQIWKPETYETEEGSRLGQVFDELPDDFDPLTLLDGRKL